jgi:hypothetical protein
VDWEVSGCFWDGRYYSPCVACSASPAFYVPSCNTLPACQLLLTITRCVSAFCIFYYTGWVLYALFCCLPSILFYMGCTLFSSVPCPPPWVICILNVHTSCAFRRYYCCGFGGRTGTCHAVSATTTALVSWTFLYCHACRLEHYAIPACLVCLQY